MNDSGARETTASAWEELSKSMAGVAKQGQRIVQDFLSHQASDGGLPTMDSLNLGGAFLDLMAKMMVNPVKLIGAQISLWQDYMTLWQNTTRRMMGLETESVIVPAKDDKRFKHEEWEENPVFDFIKQSYLLAARWIQSTVRDVDGLDEKTAKKVDFFTRQFVDALAPTNFMITNPEVLRTTLEMRGANLVRGLRNLLEDLERGKGKLHIKMTDLDAFKLGENIAVTPGKVIYQNEMMQLIQYEPSTEQVYQRPLLIVPPWINKYYIMDLRPGNSLVKWYVDQGHTVFVISWVNPDERLAQKGFNDYMFEGPLAALDAIQQATGEKQVNAVGYCLGGMLLATTLAYLAAKNHKLIVSGTYLATMLDFSEPGELEVFIDEDYIVALEKQMKEKGYLEGQSMALTFNLLRANDLIWSFVVNNYLLGKDPFPFDLLYWNSDSTRMPAEMHSFYLRNFYQKNLLKEPGAITLAGVSIDLSKVKTPAYFLSTREDHIAPWKTTYAGAQLLSGPRHFVLAMSGHIAGIINPPAAKKYGYWTSTKATADPDEWLASAEQHEGSWWPDWSKWVEKYGGKKVPARIPGEGALKALEDAPGSYVKVRTSEPAADIDT
jgi:poly(R)-hydroxyalkanoic acid synthase, class I